MPRTLHARMCNPCAGQVLIAGALLLLGAAGQAAGEPPTVVTEVVTAQSEVRTVVAYGRAVAEDAAPLSFGVPGRLLAIDVEIGQRVETGQRLARLDAGALRTQCDARRADMDAAQAQIEVADRALELARARAEVHIDAHGTPEADVARQLADAESARRAAVAALSKSHAGYEQAVRDLADAVLLAPFSGVITARTAEANERVRAGQTVVSLASSAGLRADVRVAAAELPLVSIGRTCLVDIGGGTVLGTVSRVGAEATRGMVEVSIALPGQTPAVQGEAARARCSIEIGGVVTVPLSAVVWAVDGTHVWVFADAHAELRSVVVRSTADGRRFVVDGLMPGERVIVRGATRLTGSGTAVSPADAAEGRS